MLRVFVWFALCVYSHEANIKQYVSLLKCNIPLSNATVSRRVLPTLVNMNIVAQHRKKNQTQTKQHKAMTADTRNRGSTSNVERLQTYFRELLI